jgi:uncharacterized repeat protein (TIGR01451 family)
MRLGHGDNGQRRFGLERLEERVLLAASSANSNIGILLLDHSSQGALTSTGAGRISVVGDGAIVIDSNSSQAGVARGNVIVSASEIDVAGQLKATGHGHFVGTIVHPPPTADPFISATLPAADTHQHSAVFALTGRLTLSPGTYVGGIHVSGNAKVTMLPGLYYLKGGGLSVQQNGQLTGNSVTIYNDSHSAADEIMLGDNAVVSLTAPGDGEYQNLVLAQNRNSTTPLMFLGGRVNLAGVVYAPKATLNLSGGTSFGNFGGSAALNVSGELILNKLNCSGNGRLNVNCKTADLSVTVSDDRPQTNLIPGQTDLAYYVTVTNEGPTKVSGDQVQDIFSAGLTNAQLSVSPSLGASSADTYAEYGWQFLQDPNFTDTISLDPGASITYSIYGVVASDAIGTFDNNATITSPAGFVNDSNLANNTATDSHTVTPEASIGVTIDDGVTAAVPGSTLNYTITVSSVGPSDAHNITVSDTMPTSIASFSVIGPNGFTAQGIGGETFADPNLFLAGTSSTFSTIYFGDTVTYQVTAVVSPMASGLLNNTVTITPPPDLDEIIAWDDSATDTDNIGPAADLAVSVSHGADSVVLGMPTTYTVTVTNNGPTDVVGAHVVDHFPLDITDPVFSGGTSTNDDILVSTGGKLNPQATNTYAGTTTLSSSSLTLDSGAFSNGTLNTNSGGTIVSTGGDLGGGGGVIINDLLDPDPFSAVSYTAVGGAGASGFTASGSGDIDDYVNLSAGGSITYTVSATVSPWAYGFFGDEVLVTEPSTVVDLNQANNIAIDWDRFATPTADLEVTQTDSSGTAYTGLANTSTITITNHGPSGVGDVVVSDVFPSQVASDSYTTTFSSGAGYGSGGYHIGSNGSLNLGTSWQGISTIGGGFIVGPYFGGGNINDTVYLAPGASISYQITEQLDPTASGTLTNNVTATLPTGVLDPNTANNSATSIRPISAPDDLSVAVSGATGTGGLLLVQSSPATTTYTVTVSNNGPHEVTGALVNNSVTADTDARYTGLLGLGKVTLPAGPFWSVSEQYTATGTNGTSGFTTSGTGNISDTVNIPAGGNITYTVIATATNTSDPGGAASTLVDSATITPSAGFSDAYSSNNFATYSYPLATLADLAVTMTDNAGASSVTGAAGTVSSGGTIVYTIVATNSGPTTVSGISLQDTLPEGITGDTLTFTNSVGVMSSYFANSFPIVFTGLVPGASETFVITAAIDSQFTGQLTNSVLVTQGFRPFIGFAVGTTLDPNFANNSASVTDTVWSS